MRIDTPSTLPYQQSEDRRIQRDSWHAYDRVESPRGGGVNAGGERLTQLLLDRISEEPIGSSASRAASPRPRAAHNVL